MAPVGTVIPALIVAPDWPAAPLGDEDVELELPHAAIIAPSRGSDIPTTAPRRMKSRRDSLPADELVDDVVPDVALPLAEPVEAAMVCVHWDLPSLTGHAERAAGVSEKPMPNGARLSRRPPGLLQVC